MARERELILQCNPFRRLGRGRTGSCQTAQLSSTGQLPGELVHAGSLDAFPRYINP